MVDKYMLVAEEDMHGAEEDMQSMEEEQLVHIEVAFVDILGVLQGSFVGEGHLAFLDTLFLTDALDEK